MKGLRKKHEARARTGAARIALEAGVPLVRPGSPGPTGSRGWRRCASPTGRRSTSTTCAAGTRARSRRRRPTGSWPRSTSSRRRSRDETAAGRRRRLVRAPRLPRAAEVDPAGGRPAREPARRAGEHALRPVAAGAAPRGGGRLGLARAPDLPTRGVRGLPVRPGVRRRPARAARPRAGARGVVRLRLREGGRLRGRRLPRGSGGGVRRAGLVATSDRDAFQLPASASRS